MKLYNIIFGIMMLSCASATFIAFFAPHLSIALWYFNGMSVGLLIAQMLIAAEEFKKLNKINRTNRISRTNRKY